MTVMFMVAFTLILPQTPPTNAEKQAVSDGFRIGHPLTLLLFDSNLNLDSDKAETYSLDLIRFVAKSEQRQP